MTKSVGCHKRAKPGGEREEKGGWEGGGGGVEKQGCKRRQSDPSGSDKAEWKTDECGERGRVWGAAGWSVDLLGRIYCLAGPISPPPPLFFSPWHSFSISAFPS